MGITGLLPFLDKASRRVHVSEFKGSKVAIDVYCKTRIIKNGFIFFYFIKRKFLSGWLHKGAFGCAEQLVKGQKTDGYIVYVMKYVDLLTRNGLQPVLGKWSSDSFW